MKQGCEYDESTLEHKSRHQAEEIVRLTALIAKFQNEGGELLHVDDPQGRPRLSFDNSDMENRRITARAEGWREACEAMKGETVAGISPSGLSTGSLEFVESFLENHAAMCDRIRDQGPPE